MSIMIVGKDLSSAMFAGKDLYSAILLGLLIAGGVIGSIFLCIYIFSRTFPVLSTILKFLAQIQPPPPPAYKPVREHDLTSTCPSIMPIMACSSSLYAVALACSESGFSCSQPRIWDLLSGTEVPTPPQVQGICQAQRCSRVAALSLGRHNSTDVCAFLSGDDILVVWSRHRASDPFQYFACKQLPPFNGRVTMMTVDPVGFKIALATRTGIQVWHAHAYTISLVVAWDGLPNPVDLHWGQHYNDLRITRRDGTIYQIRSLMGGTSQATLNRLDPSEAPDASPRDQTGMMLLPSRLGLAPYPDYENGTFYMAATVESNFILILGLDYLVVWSSTGEAHSQTNIRPVVTIRPIELVVLFVALAFGILCWSQGWTLAPCYLASTFEGQMGWCRYVQSVAGIHPMKVFNKVLSNSRSFYTESSNEMIFNTVKVYNKVLSNSRSFYTGFSNGMMFNTVKVFNKVLSDGTLFYTKLSNDMRLDTDRSNGTSM